MNQNTPLVSVILPVYNGERFLKDTVDSIVNQSYNNLEIIIVDDASSDTSRDIIDSYQDDRIIKIYKVKNENVCCASNLAFERANGEYIALIGHDDIWHLDKIEKQVSFMETNPNYAICFSRCDIIDQNNQIINGQNFFDDTFNSYENQERASHIYQLYMRGNHLCAPSAVIRKSVLNEVGLYDCSLLQLQDYDLWLRILTVSNIYILEEKLLKYRQVLDAKSNLSSGNVETAVRTEHESLYIGDRYLHCLSNELYKEAFSLELVKSEVSSDEEFLCEKMLLLKKMSNPYWTKRCSELLNNKSARCILDDKYNYTIQEFYKDNKEVVFLESEEHLRTTIIEKLIDENRKKEEKILYYQHLQNLYNIKKNKLIKGMMLLCFVFLICLLLYVCIRFL